jgi:hypothetical protein
MHYTRDQCKRAAESLDVRWAKIELPFCWQHNRIAANPGAANPEIVSYWKYMTKRPA